MKPNDLVWSPLAVAQLDAALGGCAPAEVARLVERLTNLPPRAGWGRPDEDEVMTLYCAGFRVTYRLVGAGTTLKILELRELPR